MYFRNENNEYEKKQMNGLTLDSAEEEICGQENRSEKFTQNVGKGFRVKTYEGDFGK